MYDPPWYEPGVLGEVAMGEKKGSTGGLVSAVCNAVSRRRGPAGLGMIMTSGIGVKVDEYDATTDCITSLIILKLARLAKCTMTTDEEAAEEYPRVRGI
jgi:hypothetical protein